VYLPHLADEELAWVNSVFELKIPRLELRKRRNVVQLVILRGAAEAVHLFVAYVNR
jgi:hypothetical protein